MRRVHRLLGFLSLPVLGAGGCTPAPPIDPVVTELRRADGTTAPEDEVLVARLAPPADPAEWFPEATAARVRTVAGVRLLSLAGGTDHRLTIPGPFEPGSWNVLAADVVAGAELWLRAGLRRTSPGESAAIGSSDTPHLRTGERRRVTFDLRVLDAHDAPFDELLLGANGPEDLAWDLASIELVRRPPARWLPAIEDGPGPVLVDGETRAAVALASGAALQAGYGAPAGAVLQLGAAPSPGTELPPGARVAVLADGDPVATLAMDGAGWRDLRVAIPGNGEGTLRFELAGAAPDAVVALEPPRLFVPDAEAPTVLLVTSDTHRGDHLGGATNGVDVRTPALERLAARGVRFEDCFATSNITLPSHAALLSGTSPRETGVLDNRTPLAAGTPTLAERFEEAGWVTFASTSTKLLSPHWSGLSRGFERHAAPPSDLSQPGDATLERLEGWLPAAAGRPLFVWLHLYDAHRPYAPPEGWADPYYPPDRDPYDPARELDAPDVPGLPGVRDRDWVHALYRGEVSWVDELVGRLLEDERFARGIVAFTADHGECLGDQGLWWDHLSAYPAVLHVPLVLAWPGAPAGRRVEEPVRHADVGRTLLGLAGIPPGDFPGADLRRWLEDAPPAPEPRFAVADEGQALAVSEDGWHLIVHLRAPEKPHLLTRDLLARPVELFDLRRDPGCEIDRGPEEPERLARLAKRLLAWAESAPAQRGAGHALDAASREMLAGLGYGSGGDGSVSESFVDLALLRSRLEPYLPR